MSKSPFAVFRSEIVAETPLRAAITAAARRPEPECVPPLLALAALTPDEAERVERLARRLVMRLREKTRSGGVEGLIHEYSLSSQEGVALMCLAEALLRIPDAATRDALIRDKLAPGDWRAHVGASPSLFVNAATWGLVLTGKLVGTSSEQTLGAALTRLIGRGGEPIIRAGVDVAMRLMGEQFVTGRTIEEAIAASREREARGFTFSYDMLGEAATTAEDARRYLGEYERAVHAIGKAARGRGIYEGPGVSIKLSALHPRYQRMKRARVMSELLPRIKRLAALAKSYDIGLNIDAEEADRLDLSLDLLEALSLDPDLSAWNGLGFVVQAYGKRCVLVVDWLVDLARRAKRRLMVRLVKGAYWDAEIKRAQVDGQDGFPVFTRKVHTDVCYLAAARKLLAAPDAVYPQFATHNAQTLASVLTLAGPNFYRGQYEFQCLHGMGEPLYEAVVGRDKLDRPCRVYAPVGSHETLLAYLVRRLLENGANTSFVNRVADAGVAIDDLVADPVALASAIQPVGAPHDKIRAPRDLYGAERLNSRGLDLCDERRLAALADRLEASAHVARRAFAPGAAADEPGDPALNPADPADVVGHWRPARPEEVAAAIEAAARAAPAWGATSPGERAAILRRAADALEAALDDLVGLVVREAGKTYANAVGEVREAVDFLRYDAAEAVRLLGPGAAPLGIVACISPWNFPLAIFTGQVAAALAAGNAVIAKPAEETPLIAAEAVRILHGAGVPADALALLPGAGEVGAAIVADPRVQGVVFTGSTAVAKILEAQVAGRLTGRGAPLPLIAETGGINAMVVDSSALSEQVAADVIASAFDSAGQRCSALRLLCLQEEVADAMLAMLKGAMAELEVGDPRRLSTDVGPIISVEACDAIQGYVDEMRGRGFAVTQVGAPEGQNFLAPAIIEVKSVADVDREVFGPVLHVLRYRRDGLDALIDAINTAGYGLTFGLHTRIDETIARVTDRIRAGNIYVNRNIIGATVGVQPFGGSRLSGTGPKAGGPLYLPRLLAEAPPGVLEGLEGDRAAMRTLQSFIDWLRASGRPAEAERCVGLMTRSPLGARVELPGPVGERNLYALGRRGRIAAIADGESAMLIQIGTILATGNDAIVGAGFAQALKGLPPEFARRIETAPAPLDAPGLAGALIAGESEAVSAALAQVAARPGPIVRVQALSPERVAAGEDYDLSLLVEERALTTNTAAAGGNASLMTIG
ncbi:L-proline dehydrogenase /delta-1-pyrroline-5-carboxylate dehydrogenase [Roseiarcus fermentans]|uniref:Bifunctional protein PutA n=2 Tax=Roseiarcus fermentans TaxID=1473586 RepID=A0A366EQR7_9HYPH|nr:L-proline dehydrogenase /delta-1-pyrroline-5-carboxylate dehydrogenase [Roseiarcus fermentans]